MRRSGFTMIELIFVIVILGILASVAIPKLAATRTDAQIASKLTEIDTLKKDLSAYYTSHGTFVASNLTDITNVPLHGATCTTNPSAPGNNVTYSYCVPNSSGTDEILFKVNLKNTNGTITFSNTTGGSGDVATAIEGMDKYTNLMKSVQAGGSHVSF